MLKNWSCDTGEKNGGRIWPAAKLASMRTYKPTVHDNILWSMLLEINQPNENFTRRLAYLTFCFDNKKHDTA